MSKIFSLIFCVYVCCITIAASQNDATHQILDIETPQIFNYNSPLKQPDSLRSRPYFDFLSTLYRHDTGKSDLFRPYQRYQRDVPATDPSQTLQRNKRAMIFRPLFVYKQQQIKRQKIQSNAAAVRRH